MIKLSPNKKMTMIDTTLSESAEMCSALTKVERKRVKKVKLAIKPVTIPSGFLFPPVTEPANTMGRIGRIQGDKMVTIPATKANNMRMIILSTIV